MAESVRAAVLVAPGRYEVQEFPMASLTRSSPLISACTDCVGQAVRRR